MTKKEKVELTELLVKYTVVIREKKDMTESINNIFNFYQKATKKYMSRLGKRSLKTMTPEERSERAKHAASKRWQANKTQT